MRNDDNSSGRRGRPPGKGARPPGAGGAKGPGAKRPFFRERPEPRGQRHGEGAERRFDDGAPARRAPRPELKRTGRPEKLATPAKEGGVERIAKVIARAGVASRRDAEELIAQGRVAVDGETIASPALDVAPNARITVDGEKLPARERTRLWLYHKPAGLVTTARDPEGRPTVFDSLPEDLPRVISIGRLDINTEGLMLLTNDGGLARVVGHPATGWLRRYRVRAFGEVTQAALDTAREGLTLDGENFGPVGATLDRTQGDNVWLTVDLREGRNREVKRVLEHFGLTVNRLIRVSFGPFQLGDLKEGEIEEVRTKVLREQLGEQLAAIAGCDFDTPMRAENRIDHKPERVERAERAPRGREERPFRDERRPREGERDEHRQGPRGDRRSAPPADGTLRRRPAYPERPHPEDGSPPPPREILLKAAEGRAAIWRDADTTGMKPKRGAPRRGADPRAERTAKEASGSRTRERAAPIADPKGRRVLVERVTGPAPDLPKRPRYTRDDFKDGARPDREPREARPARFERPDRAEGDRQDRPSRAPFRPRERDEGFRPRGDRPPQDRGAGDRPRGDRADRGGFAERGPRGDRPDRSEGRGFGGDRPGRSGPPRSGPPRSGPGRSGPGREGGGRPFGGPGGRPPRLDRGGGKPPRGDHGGGRPPRGGPRKPRG